MFEIEEAIKNQKLIEFVYDGYSRIVEPYLIGVTTKGNKTLSGFQVGGHSKNDVLGWKQFKLSEISSVTIMNDGFDVRIEYNPNDKRMVSILVRI